ncbi:MAG: hypothetical protein KKD44_18570 [Proteobacteria bacterium]|nr:hypothetical protein [Pseudomonadota bacterium]
MTLIRFMKDKARDIVYNKDPRFQVIFHEQREQGRGRYLIKTLIKELRTGKYYRAFYTAGVRGWKKHPIQPFDTDEPVFQEVSL